MRNGWVIVDTNLEKNRKWKWNLQEMNNYISCFWSYYLIGYIYVDTCSKFQIDLLRNVWDMHKRIFFIFNFKTGNEIEINRKWIFTFHDFEFNYLIGSTYVGICSKFQTSWMRNGWDIVDSNLEKTGNEIEFNRKWIITFPVFEVNIL